MTYNVKAPKKAKKSPHSYTILTGAPVKKKLYGYDFEDYNGWTNYTTWDVALNIDNDQYFHEESRNAIRDGTIKSGADYKVWFKEELENGDMYNEEYNSYKISDSWSERELDNDVNWEELYQTHKRDVEEEDKYAEEKKEKENASMGDQLENGI